MSSARSVLRPLVGGELGRRYYVSGATNGTSTSDQLTDSRRTEDRDFWNGATIKVAADEVLVRGSSPDGYLYLDTPLPAGAPANPTSYELVKGWTIADLNRGLDEACAWSFPWAFEPLNDSTTVTETDLTPVIALAASWRDVKHVRRQIGTATTPVLWQDLLEGRDFNLRQGAVGLEYEARYTTSTGRKLWFVGEKTLTLAAGDSSTNRAEDRLLVAGGLWWVFKKGPDPAEASTSRWETKAEKQWALFREACRLYGMPRDSGKVSIPVVTVVNDGSRSGVNA